MTGDRRSPTPVAVLILLVACSGGRETGTPSTASRDTAGLATDSTVAPPARPDTVAKVDTATAVARAPTTKPAPAAVPAPQPAAPKKPAPRPRPAPTDTAEAPAAPADTARPNTPTSATGAPLRDAYHQAPRDTVSAEVYDGWKQFNLNCARCHGEDVLGTTIAPHLLVSVRTGGPMDTKEAFVQTVCAGRPEKGMPSWCALGMEMDKINAIYSYVKGRSDGKIAPGRPARKE